MTNNNNATAIARLTGDELRNTVESLRASNHSTEFIVQKCGYFSFNDEGEVVIDRTGYYTELLLSKGVDINATPVVKAPTINEDGTAEFTIRYELKSYWYVTVDRDPNITEEDLLASIDKDELLSGEENSDSAWDELKDAWANAGVGELYITNADGDEMFLQD